MVGEKFNIKELEIKYGGNGKIVVKNTTTNKTIRLPYIQREPFDHTIHKPTHFLELSFKCAIMSAIIAEENTSAEYVRKMQKTDHSPIYLLLEQYKKCVDAKDLLYKIYDSDLNDVLKELKEGGTTYPSGK